MRIIDRIHGDYVHQRRVRVLTEFFASSLPRDLLVLDVGCGDGLLALTLARARPDLKIVGVDVLERPDCAITMTTFDGERLPFDKGEFDVVLMADVLHHTEEPIRLLKEARRVSRQWIALKDHTRNGLLAAVTLRFMDKVGNSRHGVALPHVYWSKEEWSRAFQELCLTVQEWTNKVPLYPWPGSIVFTRRLHFCALLDIKNQRIGPKVQE